LPGFDEDVLADVKKRKLAGSEKNLQI
jgi:hypothetical protein